MILITFHLAWVFWPTLHIQRNLFSWSTPLPPPKARILHSVHLCYITQLPVNTYSVILAPSWPSFVHDSRCNTWWILLNSACTSVMNIQGKRTHGNISNGNSISHLLWRALSMQPLPLQTLAHPPLLLHLPHSQSFHFWTASLFPTSSPQYPCHPTLGQPHLMRQKTIMMKIPLSQLLETYRSAHNLTTTLLVALQETTISHDEWKRLNLLSCLTFRIWRGLISLGGHAWNLLTRNWNCMN